jgi:hypothetical protein
LTLICLLLAQQPAFYYVIVDAVSQCRTPECKPAPLQCAPACSCFICLLSVLQLLRSGPDSTLHSAPLWARPGLAGGRCCDAALVREFRREAGVVRCGMEGDLIKVRQLAGHSQSIHSHCTVNTQQQGVCVGLCGCFFINCAALTECTACEWMSRALAHASHPPQLPVKASHLGVCIARPVAQVCGPWRMAVLTSSSRLSCVESERQS